MRRNFQIDGTDGPVIASNYTEANFIATLEAIDFATDTETLTGAGAISLGVPITHLSSSTGTYAMTLPDGAQEAERKWIYFTGTGGRFNVSGTFWDWTKLSFAPGERGAELVWVGGKWMVLGGNCSVI